MEGQEISAFDVREEGRNAALTDIGVIDDLIYEGDRYQAFKYLHEAFTNPLHREILVRLFKLEDILKEALK